MDLLTLRAFVKHAPGTQDVPEDYYAVKTAMLRMFPKLANLDQAANDLARRAAQAGRLRPPVKRLLTKLGGVLGHAVELGGLGILARPSLNEMRGKPMDERSKAKHELLGLGTLAAPSAYHLLTHR